MQLVSRGIRFACITFVAVTLAGCGGAPDAAEGTRRLTGDYVLRDTRPGAERNPALTAATLRLNPDGTGIQRCTFRNGAPFEASLTWKYDGSGNVYLSAFKDCSWIRPTTPTDGPRERGLDRPTRGASLIVDWAERPGIIIDPDLNPSYDWIQSVPAK